MIARSIVGKLWLTIAVLLLATFIILGFFLSQLMENFYLNLKANELLHNGTEIAEAIGTGNTPKNVLENIELLSEVLNASIIVLDRRGLTQASSGPMKIEPGTPVEHADLEIVVRGETVVRKGMHPRFNTLMMSVAVPVFHDQKIAGGVFIDAPLAPITATISRIKEIILYTATAITAVATVLAFFLSRSMSRPLIQMNQAAMAMAKGDFSKEINFSSRDEMGVLASTLKHLGQELESNINALHAEKKQLANILGSMTDGVISFDAHKRVITLNPPAEKILNLLGAQAVSHKQLPKTEISVKLNGLIEQAMAQEQLVSDEVLIKDNNYLFKITLIKGVEEVIGAVLVLSNITKERKLDQLRKEFIANVSHELRTPLSFLQGYVEAILDGLASTEAERQNYLQIILEETLRLRRLVNDLLDITQMEAGQIPLNIEYVDLNYLVKKVQRKLEPVANELQLKFVAKLPTNSQLIVAVDQDRIEQALINLLDNAFRYTPAGGKVTLEIVDGVHAVKVKVIDTGTGIPAADIPFLFERFHKVDKSGNRAYGGTGLGLAIVKNILDAHEQSVDVHSVLGEGSIFTFTLPKAKIQQ